VLCLQEDAAPRILPMLKAAMRELILGAPDRLATDIGPVITPAAAADIRAYVEGMRAAGYEITQGQAPAGADFVAPTIIEIPDWGVLGGEVFGPVLHVLTYKRDGLDGLIDAIHGTGYGLTFGLHSRIDATVAHVTSRIHAGNIYVNRNMVGAVVGVQPFGGHGLSGTGPKAGGPLYLRRLVRGGAGPMPGARELPGPVGERNEYTLRPRRAVLCLFRTPEGKAAQLAAVTAAGSTAVFDEDADFDAVLLEGDVLRASAMVAARPGPIVAVHAGPDYDPAWLVRECVVSTNTAAAGGNASLMTLA
jgi:RHH-type proline utilization regulon transcriptional repressor/proline dehydrogenase/delta 1-pyrroline-5-carboxylate dehydrogenase